MSCTTPNVIKVKEGTWDTGMEAWTNHVKVPCGKCYDCKKLKVNQWCFRLKQEHKRSHSAYFITLTYDTEHLPLTQRKHKTLVKTTEQSNKLWEIRNGERILTKKVGRKKVKYVESGKEILDYSLQGFFKRLRYYEEETLKKRLVYLSQHKRRNTTGLWTDKKLKMYSSGEYGELRKRPHYHIILFNLMAEENLIKAWPYGNVDIGEVTEASIIYTLKYINKDQSEKVKGFDGINEFSLMSKGLGDNYINEESIDFHKREYNGFTTLGKQKVTLSKYYKDKMLNKRQKENQTRFQIERHKKIEKEERRVDEKKGVNYEEKKVKIAMNKKNILNSHIKKRDID